MAFPETLFIKKEVMLEMLCYDVKIYNIDGREGPTVRGLTFAQMLALTEGLNNYNVQHLTIAYEKGV